MDTPIRIAVILCCYNRKKYTDRCISQVYEMGNTKKDLKIDFFVCDDNSTDGTSELLKEKYPFIKLFKTHGNLFWCKSMHLVMKCATYQKFDFYLMINDDVDFFPDAIDIMLKTYNVKGGICGVVGATVWDEQVTYGGWRGKDLLTPNGEIQECEWTNWNCFLIPHRVVESVGIIDSKYQHSYGDFDYAFRMQKANIPIYLASSYVGRCSQNPIKNTYRDADVPIMKRIKMLMSPKGLPIYSYFRYHIRIYGARYMLYFIWGYFSLIWYILLGRELE